MAPTVSQFSALMVNLLALMVNHYVMSWKASQMKFKPRKEAVSEPTLMLMLKRPCGREIFLAQNYFKLNSDAKKKPKKGERHFWARKRKRKDLFAKTKTTGGAIFSRFGDQKRLLI